MARDFGGHCFMRFDDTNPVKEDATYAEAILEDIRWLGFNWGERLTHASDYFEALYEFACVLIRRGKAYVDSLSADQIREYRGTLTEAGRNSPFRERGIEENLDLFQRMREGEFEDGSHVLRARIDMAAPNIHMRDPTLYRIRKVPHQRTGDAWCIYPMYDFTHCLSDALEGVTHSLCTLEFEDNRPLYDWVLREAEAPCLPHQYEFSRLNLQYTVLSKRKLIQLVEEGHVEGWDDPRMPSLIGIRRRGFPPESVRLFCERIGISKSNNNIDFSVLEDCAREVLNQDAPRAFAVLKPLKVVITNFAEDQVEMLDAPVHPQNPEAGRRSIPLTREIYIEEDDFLEDPPRKFFRLAPGKEVRLRYGYVIRCDEVVRDASGKISELRCSYDPQTAKGVQPEGRKVKGIIHWVSASQSIPAEVRLYDRLFREASPGSNHEDGDFLKDLNPDSVEILKNCRLESGLKNVIPGSRFQFERLGYFCSDEKASSAEPPVFNRIVTLRDTWAKLKQNS
jgi:glutaminyl-tRNA synthetase